MQYTIQKNVLFRGNRVVIPAALQKSVLQELHTGHFGVVKMKKLARGICWWPGIDVQIENLAKSCSSCNTYKDNPPKCETHVWEPNAYPFQRVHLDFAGPFRGHNFLLLVDSFSKWPEVHLMRNTSAEATVKKCREIFATFGLPEMVVTDNGTAFTSNTFRTFLKQNGIQYKTTAPYNPSTNGQVERFVRTLKQSLRSSLREGKDIYNSLLQLLFQYRIMPHQGTGVSPSIKMFSRNIRSKLDLLHPRNEQGNLNINLDKKCFSFKREDRVAARNYVGRDKWYFGKIIERIGKLHYKIKLDNGLIWKRHLNQIRACQTPRRNCATEVDYNWPATVADNQLSTPAVAVPEMPQIRNEGFEAGTTAQVITRPKRVVKPPVRYGQVST